MTDARYRMPTGDIITGVTCIVCGYRVTDLVVTADGQRYIYHDPRVTRCRIGPDGEVIR